MDKRVDSVAFVLPGLGAGGSEHVVSMLCNELAEQGYAVTQLAFVDAGTTPYYPHHPKVEVIDLGRPAKRLGRLGQLLSPLIRVYRLRGALRRIQPDVVISFLTRTNIITLLAARGIPVIVSERNNAAFQHVPALWSWLRRRLYPRAAALVTMTRGAMTQFADFSPPVQRVIPNPAVAYSRHRPGTGKGHLVAVGRLVPQKGFDLLLEAFAKAVADRPDWTLTIWGDGPERAALEEQRERLGLKDRVYLPGLTRAPGTWTHDADLFVLSSRFEGWGLVVGEAMAAGIPTISFDCDFGPSEMIDNGVTGVLVRNGDVAELARELARLFADDEERKRLGKAAHEAMKQFTAPAIVSRWLALITGEQPIASRDGFSNTAASVMIT